jgi:hypothetical protein
LASETRCLQVGQVVSRQIQLDTLPYLHMVWIDTVMIQVTSYLNESHWSRGRVLSLLTSLPIMGYLRMISSLVIPSLKYETLPPIKYTYTYCVCTYALPRRFNIYQPRIRSGLGFKGLRHSSTTTPYPTRPRTYLKPPFSMPTVE